MTVGLVIVSHSARIAEGVVELAAQMAPSVVIAAAGGTDDGRIGTSFEKVQAAIARADSGDGAVVLCDLGSAVMTAETALDLADASERIRIADAPLVEGAVAAAVAADGGAGLDRVVAVAEAGATAAPPPAASDAQPPTVEEGARLVVRLENEHGLHARPAAALVRTATGFDADVTVNGSDAKSLLRVLSLGLDRGSTATFEATGPQAAEAIAAIRELAVSGFGEQG